MNTHRSPREIAEAMLSRSVCLVQVGACLEDSHGVFSWGWNSVGASGYGIHAEAHAILRANRGRLKGATIYVASKRIHSRNPNTSRPCLGCQILLQGMGIKAVWWRDKNGDWNHELV